jgi:hypothetical protein
LKKVISNDKILKINKSFLLSKGKPAERQGRKTSGLIKKMVAGLPGSYVLNFGGINRDFKTFVRQPV